MLSILIPIYNYDCRKLVKALVSQAIRGGGVYELLAFDDGSERYREENREISGYPGCIYREMDRNIGRSAIRNRLADAARYSYLLFMDCDSQVIDDRYLEKYLENAIAGRVICGGRCFIPEKELTSDFRLHWIYGIYREPRPGENKGLFLSNNFLIPKTIFDTIRFDERIRRYGHEDTLFGLELEKRNIPVCNLAIPLLHEGLDNNSEFVEKTQESVRNLARIVSSILPDEDARRIRLYTAYKKLKKYKLAALFGKLTGCAERRIVRNLAGNCPSLFLLDIYKLGILCREMEVHSV